MCLAISSHKNIHGRRPNGIEIIATQSNWAGERKLMTENPLMDGIHASSLSMGNFRFAKPEISLERDGQNRPK